MLITYSGPNNYYFSDGFFSPSGFVDVDITSASATRIVVESPDGQSAITLNGSGFQVDATETPSAGTITSIDFRENGSLVASFSDISWSAVTFVNGLLALESDLDPSILGGLVSQSPVTLEAAGATGPLFMDDFGFLAPFITSAMTITGTALNDRVIGGTGNDNITPGANTDYDRILATSGSDIYDFAGADDLSYYEIEYDGVQGPVTVTANTGTDSLSVTGAFGTDSFDNIGGALRAVDGGVGVVGSTGNDLFDVIQTPGTWLTLSGGAGNDTFNLEIGDLMRLFYNWDGVDGALTGIVADLAAGRIQDGLGGTDTLNLTGDGTLEIAGTDFADRFTGSARNESFITGRGNDTVDGGGGIDRVRYDRNGVDAMDIDLTAGTASGTWNGVAFTDSLTSIEYIRGSRMGDDTIRGAVSDDILEGRGGDDSLVGRGGADRLLGEDGNDTLTGGSGNDTIVGGAGLDTAILGVTRASATVTEIEGGFAIDSAEGSDVFLGIETFVFADAEVDVSDLLAPTGGTPGVVVDGTDDDDAIAGSADDDTLSGGSGDDLIAASDGDDSVDGGAGNDTIGGGPGDDTIDGSGEDDVIGAGQGNDLARGNEGNDIVNGGPGDDTLLGGAGNDTMGASFGNDLVEGNDGNDSLGGGTGKDTLRGGDGNDDIGGGEGNDSIEGGEGNDFLAGGGRNDIIDGGAGNDQINAGDGDDTMTGGAGDDLFIFNGFNDGDMDVITDFETGNDGFRMTGVENAPGSGLQGRLDALNVIDTDLGLRMTYQGHVIDVLGVSAADLSLEHFTFL